MPPLLTGTKWSNVAERGCGASRSELTERLHRWHRQPSRSPSSLIVNFRPATSAPRPAASRRRSRARLRSLEHSRQSGGLPLEYAVAPQSTQARDFKSCGQRARRHGRHLLWSAGADPVPDQSNCPQSTHGVSGFLATASPSPILLRRDFFGDWGRGLRVSLLKRECPFYLDAYVRIGGGPIHHSCEVFSDDLISLLPRSWLHLRPQVGHPSTPCAGRIRCGSTGWFGLRLIGSRWSAVSAPSCPHRWQVVP